MLGPYPQAWHTVGAHKCEMVQEWMGELKQWLRAGKEFIECRAQKINNSHLLSTHYLPGPGISCPPLVGAGMRLSNPLCGSPRSQKASLPTWLSHCFTAGIGPRGHLLGENKRGPAVLLSDSHPPCTLLPTQQGRHYQLSAPTSPF